MFEKFIVDGSCEIALKDFLTVGDESDCDKDKNKKAVKQNKKKMQVLQDKLYAYNKYSVLLIFQALDAAGKDGMIRRVTSGLNPQGTQVFSFKSPSKEELDHDYLWRTHKSMPERGRVGIFNRSYYEDVLVVRVHDMIDRLSIPEAVINDEVWDYRLEDIVNFENYLTRNGMVILKFFLNVSKEEQKARFMERIDNSDKNWKFSSKDIEERQYWNDYTYAYEQAISKTSTDINPWYIIPADDKWYARSIVSQVIVDKLESLNLKYPKLSEEEKSKLSEFKQMLLDEK